MSYSDENISDKLKKRAGTDLSDFSDESLQRVYEDSLLGIKYKGDDWDERKKDSYIEEYGTIAYDKMRDEIDYERMQGQGGDQKDWKKYAENGSGNWNTVRQAVGIKSLNSKNDIREMFKKVRDEYSKRMIGAGVDGLAKAEDISAPASTEEDAPEYTESDTFRQAKEDVEEYNDDLNTFGDNLFNFDQSPDTSESVSTSSPAVDKKDYMNAYKFNVANKMRPVSSDGKERNSIVQKFKDKQRQRGLI